MSGKLLYMCFYSFVKKLFLSKMQFYSIVKWLVSLVIIFCITQASFALPFKKIDSRMHGLYSDDILCIHQDQPGFLWFGTNYGLYRFDGIDFRMYEHIPLQQGTISGNFIFDIVEQKDGTLWFCTNNGFDRYDEATDSFVRIPIQIETSDSSYVTYQQHVNKGLITHNGSILVNIASNGIFKFNAASGSLEPIRSLAGDVISDASDIAEDNQRWIWIGTKTDGLVRFSPESHTIQRFRHGDSNSGINSNNIFSVHVDSLNYLWVGTDKGINYLVPGSVSFQALKPSIPVPPTSRMNQVYCITSDSDNNVWFGTNGIGLHVLMRDEMKIVNYSVANGFSLSSDNIRSIFHDRQGNLWVGTNLGGISYVLNNNALVFQGLGPRTATLPGLSHASVTAIAENGTDRLWVGTDGGGLNLHHKLTGVTSQVLEGTLSSVLTIHQEENGALWMGGYLEGLIYYNPRNNTFAGYTARPDDVQWLGHNDVRMILEDSGGSLWVATNGGGLHRFDRDKKTFTRFRHNPENPNSLISDHCIALYEDARGNLLVGTYNGFSILDSTRTRFKSYISGNNPQSLSGNWVYAFCEDNDGRLWVGTNYGLNIFDPNTGTFKAYTKQEGLPGNEVYSILSDDNDHLWLGTNIGLCRFDPDAETFLSYDLRDGIQGNRFNSGAAIRNKEGVLYFGGNNGLTWFHPDFIKTNPEKPPVYITSLMLPQSGKTIYPFSMENGIGSSPGIKIPFREASVIVLNYTALNLINSEKSQYRYMLEGFDTDWRNPGSQREATYTNLKPGNYTFSVIASNNDGVWNTQGAAVQIRITPPIHRTTLAYVFYFLAGAALLYFIIQYSLIKIRHRRQLAIEQYKLKKTEELARLKSDFFISISHELSTPITLILTPLQRMLDQGKITNTRLIEIAVRNAQSLLRMVNELLDFQKTESGKTELLVTNNELISYVSSILDSFIETYREKGIALSFHPGVKRVEMMFDTEKMEKILYNLLSNAYKYTHPNGSVSVSVNLMNDDGSGSKNNSNEFVEIIVSDTGIGISAEDLPHLFEKYYRARPVAPGNALTQSMGYGIGLFVTRTMVDLHGGQIEVKSTRGVGSEFILRFPIQKPISEAAATDANSTLPLAENDYAYAPEAVPENIGDPNDEENLPLVLIVDDNPQIIELLKEILSSNYRIIEAVNGEKGHDAACRYSPDLIITDVMMPGIDGVQLCERIKSDFYTCHIPVILLTALNDNYFRLKGYQTGADDYISKPFNPRILETRVHNIIASRRMLQKKFLSDIQVVPGEVTSVSADEVFLENAIAAVEKNIDNPEFSVVELASEMNMSKATLYRKITAITSQNPSQFIRTIRLKRAANLLKTTDYNVSEVVYMVGLNDIKHFRKSFQKLFGKNPTEFKGPIG
jgi:signal transduction histidine kinase/ligand-binding sensor domain-containing protein/DNA-binding response OmpR family regulator